MLERSNHCDEALKICKAALECIERKAASRNLALGDMIDVCRACNVIGGRLYSDGCLADAESYFLRAYREWEKLEWPHHHDAIGTLSSLSATYLDLRQHQKA